MVLADLDMPVGWQDKATFVPGLQIMSFAKTDGCRALGIVIKKITFTRTHQESLVTYNHGESRTGRQF